MASIETSYFNLFMEDLISFKEELFSDSDDCLHKSGSQQLYSHCVTNYTSLRNLSVQSTPQRRSAPSHHLTWDCRSLGRGIGCVCFEKMKTVFLIVQMIWIWSSGGRVSGPSLRSHSATRASPARRCAARPARRPTWAATPSSSGRCVRRIGAGSAPQVTAELCRVGYQM